MNNALVKLVIKLDQQESYVAPVEVLWVEKLGNGRFRIDNSPFYSTKVSCNDVVAAEVINNMLEFKEVLVSGGHSTFHLAIKKPYQQDIFDKYWKILSDLGCTYEGSDGANILLLSVDAPPSTDLKEVVEGLKLGESDNFWEYQVGKISDSHNKSQI